MTIGTASIANDAVPIVTASYRAAIQGRPNTAVKGKFRLLAALKVVFLIGFGGFVERPLAARPLPLRWA